MTWVLVAVGGAVGALLRDLSGRRRGAESGTDLANRAGAVLLGVVVAAAAAGALDGPAVALLGVGLAGGLTTFSTWVVQIVEPADAARRPHWTRLVRETLLGLALAAVALVATTAVLG